MMIGGMGVEAMPDRGWKRKFDEPIPLPAGGRELVTLEDAKGSDGKPDLEREILSN
jgi:hypothetical protein